MILFLQQLLTPSARPSHLPPKCEEESEHHRNLVRLEILTMTILCLLIFRWQTSVVLICERSRSWSEAHGVSASESERIVYEKDGVLVSDYKLKALKRCKFQQTWAIKALTSGCSSTSQWYFYHSDLILSLTLDFNHWVSNNPPCHLLHPFSLISHHLRSNGDYSKNRKRSKFLFPDVEKKRFKQW